jgi:fibronectin type 3 domain-containing protein
MTALDKNDRECEPSFGSYEDYVFHPIKLNLSTIVNEGLFFSEKMNRLRWKKSPLNDPVNVVKYVIYRKKASESKSKFAPFLVTEDAKNRVFWDRSIPLDQKYSYAVTSVCDNGAESGLSSKRTEK